MPTMVKCFENNCYILLNNGKHKTFTYSVCPNFCPNIFIQNRLKSMVMQCTDAINCTHHSLLDKPFRVIKASTQ